LVVVEIYLLTPVGQILNECNRLWVLKKSLI